jgi:malonyl-CoA O-methyltransferase
MSSDGIHVEIRGTGPDVVLLHGWALHGGMWGAWLDELAHQFRLHIVDLPGHGRSPWPAGVRDLRGLARAVAPVVPRGAAIIGWSLGGMVALEFARLSPEAAALVLIATTPRFIAEADWPGMGPDVLQKFATELATDHRRTIGNFLTLQAWGDERATAALRRLRAQLDAHGAPNPQALAIGLEILRDADLRDALPGISIPTLVIAGEHDRITPATAGRELASRLPAARFLSVQRSGHAPFLSHPDEVLRTVDGFLAFLRAAPGLQASGEATPLGVPRPLPLDRGSAVAIHRAAAAARPIGTTEPADDFTLDRRRVRAAFGAAAQTYDGAAVLQSKVREELLARLDVVRLQPAVVLDLGCGTGHAASALRRRYRSSRIVAADVAPAMLRQAARRQTLWRRFDRLAAAAESLPFRDGTLGMVFSNLVFQWCDDLDLVLRECRRALQPGGLLHFTTFGPDTLVELRRAWAQADPGHAHVSRFIDMHDIGDALVRAGFAEPVLDVERYTLTYADARDLMRDLKAIGAHNATAGRARGLTGKATLQRMLDAYEQQRREGRLPATYEVVFAQAWAPEKTSVPSPARSGSEVVVPLSKLGRRS